MKNIHEILLVEDDEVDIMNIERAFKKNNFTNKTIIARDGQEALDILHSGQVQRPVITLLDLNMPRMNGIEFLEALRKDPEWYNLIVIVVTSSREEFDKVAAYDRHVAGYIVKPVRFEDFIAAMSQLGKYWTLSELPVR